MFPLTPKTHTRRNVTLVVEHSAIQEQNVQFYFPSLTTGKYDWVRDLYIEVTSDFLRFYTCYYLPPDSRWLSALNIPLPWRWRRRDPPKSRVTFNGLYGVIYQTKKVRVCFTFKIKDDVPSRNTFWTSAIREYSETSQTGLAVLMQFISVSIATGYGLHDRGVGVRVPVGSDKLNKCRLLRQHPCQGLGVRNVRLNTILHNETFHELPIYRLG
jgi:hypothetical protein